MGQKINPLGFRVGIYEPWRSRWYATKKEFARLLLDDQKIRRYIKKNYRFAAIPRIDIERTRERVNIFIHTARPGILIGRKGAKVDQLKADLQEITGKEVFPNIIEINKPELSAVLVAESIAEQLEKRSAFRRTMKKAAQLTMQSGAGGMKLQVSGRLGGSEMARCETMIEGRMPLQTLQAHIDYGFTEAATPYGNIGIKVWIYRGEFSKKPEGGK